VAKKHQAEPLSMACHGLGGVGVVCLTFEERLSAASKRRREDMESFGDSFVDITNNEDNASNT